MTSTGLVEAMRSAAQAGIAANLFIPAANKIESQAKALSEAETAYDGLMKAKETFRAEAHRNAARAIAAEARLAEAMKVIEPFTVEYLNQVHPDWALATWVTFTVGELRAARAFTDAAKTQESKDA